MSPVDDVNQRVISEFRANRGRVGGSFAGVPLLLLHSVGARSGESRIHPMMYLCDGERIIVFASKGGAPTNPSWYHNLRVHPNATIEVGSDRVEVTATEITGAEREILFRRQAARYPRFDEYQAGTPRLIPVIALTSAAQR
ncbi:MAG TPA: nitroreductase family deazaflavin-dependent oxidoreductase [Verrucomicrobiae bacterium]|nr:nitroreductase family deazaflavin-dependent oxidoreductase [Verrucomicrobiae bacterium]